MLLSAMLNLVEFEWRVLPRKSRLFMIRNSVNKELRTGQRLINHAEYKPARLQIVRLVDLGLLTEGMDIYWLKEDAC